MADTNVAVRTIVLLMSACISTTRKISDVPEESKGVHGGWLFDSFAGQLW